MKNLIYVGLVLLFLWSCTTSQKTLAVADNKSKTISDTVRIANDSLEYEVIIIDNGFSTWLASRAQPRNYYSLNYLESKNNLYVTEWNNRVLQPQRYGNLYEMTINYSPNIHYGYEVNYLIYNYFIYFQNTHNQKLAGYVPMR